MALVIPIMLALVFNFLAIMVTLRVHAEAEAALSLATQSAASAPAFAPTASCYYAGTAFYSTLYSTPEPATAFPCGGGFPPLTLAPPASEPGYTPIPKLTCDSNPVAGAPNFFTGAGYAGGPTNATPPGQVHCVTTVTFNFRATTFGLLVPWAPTMTLSHTASVPNTRQCAPTKTCT